MIQEAYSSLDVAEKSLQGQTDIGFIIRALRDAYVRAFRYAYADINCGQCEDFAEQVARILPVAETCWDDTMPDARSGAAYYVGHCFIVHKGRFYDAEAPDGVSKWTELPCELPD